jgi:rod shape-determining protein MreC
MPIRVKRKSVLLLGALALFHLLLISVQVPLGAQRKLFERGVFFVFSPVQKTAVAAYRGIRSIWANYVDLRRVREDNQKLKQEMFFLEQEKRVLEDRLLRFRNEAEIRETLAAFKKSLIPARVIGTDAENVFRSIIIDRGQRAGVKPDMPVCDRYGNLVGRTIIPVSPDEAVVQLITDPESSVSVVTETDKIVGILSGKQGPLCAVKYILGTVQSGKQGDGLVTTGFDKIYPAGLPVARILSIKSNSTVFKDIVARPYFNFGTLDVVAVLPTAAGEKR